MSWEMQLSGPFSSVGVGTSVGLTNGVAHALQNAAPGGLLAPQAEHRCDSGAPQALQNFASEGFSC